MRQRANEVKVTQTLTLLDPCIKVFNHHLTQQNDTGHNSLAGNLPEVPHIARISVEQRTPKRITSIDTEERSLVKEEPIRISEDTGKN